MKKVYIAHPLLGDMDRKNPNLRVLYGNIESVEDICCRIVKEHPDILPLSPISAFSFLDAFDRTGSMGLCYKLLSLADELWVFGDWMGSEGCLMEIRWAREMGIPVELCGGAK